MYAFFGFCGLAGIAVSSIILIIKAIKKQPKRKALIALAVCFAVVVIAFIKTPSPSENSEVLSPTDIPAPTDMPAPTDTPTPTDTPAPTDTPTATNEPEKAISNDVYEIKGEKLGEYGKKVILNENTDLPATKYLYKLPAGTYEVTTDTDKMASFFIVKDEITQNSDNPDYPEELNYVSSEGYLLTAGDNDFNGHAKKSVTVELAEDESFQIVGTDTLFFTKIK